ncbi:hypothetical protein OG349_06800 [Streptomyces sp. NBC_01317]|uniref:hypothetical protein n=1 Tax=Streptomyces sp. NBC_01317 TaxID=2903822 RepID=UPI002E13D474|nr:hypothetical protein OG349_06800 [Streptomyces sp. NBC_01317]
MDEWEGEVTLEWWANGATCLARLDGHASVRVSGSEWTSGVTPDPPLSEGDRDALDFLMKLDPLFTLRFGEGSTLLVDVVTGDDGCLVLTAHEATVSQPLG